MPPESEDTKILPIPSAESSLAVIASRFRILRSDYAELPSVNNLHPREVYETEALRGGWLVRQVDHQFNSQFYVRTALSKNMALMLTGGQQSRPDDTIRPEDEAKDPCVLESLDLRARIPKAVLRRHRYDPWRHSFWNWAGTSASWTGRDASGSAKSGIGRICCTIAGHFDGWW